MRTPALSPSFTLSTSASSFIIAPALPAIAVMSGLDGLDVDLSCGSMASRTGELAERAVAAGAPLRSVWLSPPRSPHPRRRWFGQHGEQGWALVGEGSADTVVVKRTNPGRAGTAGAPPLDIARIRALVPSKTRIAIGLQSRELEGTRDHLIGLAALRRFAEEWDFQLALDLSGRVDPTWEVEAALTRLMPRLSMVRLRFPAFRQAEHGRDRATARAVRTLTDLHFAGTIAIVPSVRMWQRWWPPAIAESTQASAIALRDRFATVQHSIEFGSFRERPNLL